MRTTVITDTEDIMEDTGDIMVILIVTTARGPLMPSPPSLLEPAVWCPPPLLSSTTLPPSPPSHTPPTPWPMLDTPPTPSPDMSHTAVFPTLDSPCSLPQPLLLMRPWLPRGRRERLTPRSS